MASYKRSAKTIAKQTGEELVVLHPKSGNYYTLNALGNDIWQFCSDFKSEAEIIRFVAERHELSLENATKDVAPYLESLAAEGLFEKIIP